MQAIGIAGTVMSLVGTFQSASAQKAAGAAQQQQNEYVAAQQRQQAGQERAAAQRRSSEARRQGDLAQSRATAVAAASGGGALDPSVIDTIGDLQTNSEYDALNALYEGEDRARSLEMGADIKQYEGRQAKKAGNIAATSTMFSGIGQTAGSFYDRYGGTGPKTGAKNK